MYVGRQAHKHMYLLLEALGELKQLLKDLFMIC